MGSNVVASASGAELSAARLYALLRLRVEVFVVEQGCPYAELDGRDLDPATRHLWIDGGTRPVAYLRVLREGAGLRIGRVCVARPERGTGLARRLLHAALAGAGDAPCVLDAQTRARGLYEPFGFVAEGRPFDEDGIEHVRMRRSGTASEQ